MLNKLLEQYFSTKKSGSMKELLPIDIIDNGFVLMKNGYIQTAIEVKWPSLFSMTESELQEYVIKHLTNISLSLPVGSQIAFSNVYQKHGGKELDSFDNKLDKTQVKGTGDPRRRHYSYIFLGFSSVYNLADFVTYDDEQVKRVEKRRSAKVGKLNVDEYLSITGRLVKTLNDAGILKCSLMNEKALKRYTMKYLTMDWEKPTNAAVEESFNALVIGDKILSTIAATSAQIIDYNHFAYPKYSRDFTKPNISSVNSLPASFTHAINGGLDIDHITTMSFVVHDSRKFQSKVNGFFKNNNIATVIEENQRKRAITREFINSVVENNNDRIVTYSLNTMVISQTSEQFKEHSELCCRAYESIGLDYIVENYQNLTYYQANLFGNAYMIPRQIIGSVSRVNKLFPFETFGISSEKGLVVENKAGEKWLMDFVSKSTTLGNRAVKKTNYNLTLFGKTGSGKSNLLAYILKYLLNTGAHATLIDKGNSFKKLYMILKENFQCRYFTWEDNNPLSFAPFLISKKDGKFDYANSSDVMYLEQLLVEVVRENFGKEEIQLIKDIFSGFILPAYYKKANKGDIKVVGFNSFYDYISHLYKALSEKDSKELTDTEKLLINNLDFEKIQIAYRKFYRDGKFQHLFNAKENYDIEKDQLVLFELDRIQKDPFLFRIVSMCISQIQDAKLTNPALQGILKYMVIDEGTFMMNDTMAEVITGYFQTVRKHGGGMIFTDQTIDKLVDTGFANRIFGNSDTVILLEQKWTEQTERYIREYLDFTDEKLRKVKAIDNNGPWREGIIYMGGVVENFRLVLSPQYLLALNTDADNPANKRMMEVYEQFGKMELAIDQAIEEGHKV